MTYLHIRWPLIAVAVFSVTLAAVSQGIVLSVTSPPKTARPGDFVTHVFSLINTAAVPITLELSAELPTDWTALGFVPQLTIPAGEEEIVFLTVAVPPTAEAGEYLLILRARWDGEETSAQALVTVEEVAALEVIGPREGAVPPGGTISYDFEVINRGNVLDRFLVEASSAHGWPVEVSPPELVLVPGERGTVTMTLAVPPDAIPGRDLLTLTVRSSVAPTVERRALLFTIVLPPVPELVVGTEFAEFNWRVSGQLPFGIDEPPTFSFRGLSEAFGGTISLSFPTFVPPGPLKLSDLSFAFDREDLRLHFGEVSLSFATLRALSGKGFFLGISPAPGTWSVSFIQAITEQEERFGGEIILDLNGGRLGIAGRETRTEMEASRAATTWLSWSWNECILALENGFWWNSASVVGAFQAQFTLRTPKLFLEASLFSVGKNFPNPREDQEGFAISTSFRTETISLRATGGYHHDNVLRELDTPWIDYLRFSSHAGFYPKGSNLRLEGSASFNWKAEQAPIPTVHETTLTLDQRITMEVRPVRPWFRVRWTETEDRVAGTTVHSFLSEGGLWLIFSEGEFGFAWAQEETYNETGSLSDVKRTSFRFRTREMRGSFVWEYGTQGSGFTAGFAWSLFPQLRVEPKIEVRWDPEGTQTRLGLLVGFTYEFIATLPKIPVRGWLEGVVFIDENLNGLYDPGEELVEGASLATDKLRVSTDRTGRFLFPPLDPGTYEIKVERLPRGVRSRLPLPIKAEVRVGKRTLAVIPCERLGEIGGVVFDDKDKDGTRGPTEPGLAGVMVALEQDKKEIDRLITDKAGRFSFTGLSAGVYTVRLLTGTLPERYEPTTPVTVEVQLSHGEKAEVAFGAWQRPRPIIIVYQPPIADFVWAPEVPIAGKSVQFDGTRSVDPDGEVILWEWDFDGDGVIDATGSMVEWIFPAPGVYLVALTVTDNEGYKDTRKHELIVAPAD